MRVQTQKNHVSTLASKKAKLQSATCKWNTEVQFFFLNIRVDDGY